MLLACEYGRLIRTTGVSFYFLGRREADAARAWGADRRLLDRSRGLVVLMAEDGSVITAYRNRRALKAIRRKNEFDRDGGCKIHKSLERGCVGWSDNAGIGQGDGGGR